MFGFGKSTALLARDIIIQILNWESVKESGVQNMGNRKGQLLSGIMHSSLSMFIVEPVILLAYKISLGKNRFLKMISLLENNFSQFLDFNVILI